MTATHIRFREMQFFRLGKIWLLPACGAFVFFSWNVLAEVGFDRIAKTYQQVSYGGCRGDLVAVVLGEDMKSQEYILDNFVRCFFRLSEAHPSFRQLTSTAFGRVTDARREHSKTGRTHDRPTSWPRRFASAFLASQGSPILAMSVSLRRACKIFFGAASVR